MHNKQGPCRAHSAPGGVRKIQRLTKPIPAWKHDLRLCLGRDACATLGSTASEDRAASARAHPQPKTVRLRPTAVVGLEGALHGLAPGRTVGEVR